MSLRRFDTIARRTLPWLVAASLGCGGSDRGSVSGNVVRGDGQPLVGATVTARSNETGKWASGTTDSTGGFELGTPEDPDGVWPGSYYVTIREDRGAAGERPRTIPEKYERPSASGLSVTVAAGEHATLDIDLDPK